jgi:hypothetical protein
MLQETFLAEISANDIQSGQMQLIAEYCGLPDALALMEQVPGLELYVPASAKKGFEWDYVNTHYTGFNAATIAGRLGLNHEDVVRLSKQPKPMGDKAGNNHLRLIADKCGLDVAKRLARHFPGYKFYIPINGLSIAYRRYIERAFNGTNTQELALQCKVSERHIRKIISEKYQSTAQLSLFDE